MMRFSGVVVGAVFLLTGCLKADVTLYQPPCNNSDDCPFDWACIQNQCISPETPEAFIPKPQQSEDAGHNAGSGAGTVDGVTNDDGGSQGTADGSGLDAGSVEGSVDGTAIDAGSEAGTTDGSAIDAGSADGTSSDAALPLTCDDLNCGENSVCTTNDANELICECDSGYHDQDNDNNCTLMDYDSDGEGDLVDNDDDGDGVNDDDDDCPIGGERDWVSTSANDHDGDGCKDFTLEDLDDDNDGVLDINDNCPRGALEWTSNDSDDIDNDGCKNEEDTDLDGDLIPNEAQPYFSQGYKLLAANAHNLCGLHEADLIHCIAQDNPRLTDVERPYVITPFDQIDLTSDTFVALEGNRVVCEEQFEDICPSTELKYISAGSYTACGISMGTETIDEDSIICWDLPDTDNSSAIVTGVPTTGTFKQVQVGANMACAIKTDDTVTCWGNVIGGGSTLDLAPPTAEDGDAYIFTTIDVGDNFACGITDNHKIKCWPQWIVNDLNISVPSGNFDSITVGPVHYCAKPRLNNQITCGNLAGLDYDAYPLPNPSVLLTHLVSGVRFSCGLQPSTGAVACWGEGAGALYWYPEEDRTSFWADNCPSVPNPDQADEDGDDTGDACDAPSCQEGPFFSRYVTASQGADLLPGSPGGALAIYNPTSGPIDLSLYSISNEGEDLDLDTLGNVGNNLNLDSHQNFIICRQPQGAFGGGLTSDSLCDRTLNSNIFSNRDFSTLFTGSKVELKLAETVVDVIGPSPNSVTQSGGIWLEDLSQETESQLNYLRRKSTVTQGSDSFQSEEWEQVQFEGMNIELTQIGFNGTYDGCFP